MTSLPGRFSAGWSAAGVALLLGLHAALALWAVSGKSVTADEILHLTGGYLYNKFGDYRIHPENGNLPQRWAALPAVWMGAPPPRMEANIHWRTADASVVGHQFFYETGHDHWPMLMAGRTMIVVFSIGTGLLIFCWTHRLFGSPGAFLALGFYAFDPNVLAHAALVTSDTTAVFLLLAASGAFWRHLRNPTIASGALSALAFGLACVAKYSAVLLLPIMGILLAWQISTATAPDRRKWVWRTPLILAAHAAGGVLVIWAFFGFRFTGFAPGLPAADHYVVPWVQVLPSIGVHGQLVEFLRHWQLLPEAFLYGYAWVIQSAQARGAFLAGEYSIHGWVSFFPLAFLWKTPLALLAALAFGAVVMIRRWRKAVGSVGRDLQTVAPLLALFGVYWVFSLTSHLNIGHRHILPTYPVLFILIGGLAAPGALQGFWRFALPAGLGLAQVVANLTVAPHYLAFFNMFAGGPARGYRLLVDSSLDWGQDLPGLAGWLRAHPKETKDEPVYLSYFGSGTPDYYGIKATRLPFVNGFKLVHPWYEPRAGLYCVSATMLQQVYSPVRGEWTAAHEREYQTLRARVPLFREYWQNAETRREVRETGAADAFERTWLRYDVLRFARLCHYLRARAPDAMVGYSVLLYRLTDEEVAAALDRNYSDWLRAVERARNGG